MIQEIAILQKFTKTVENSLKYFTLFINILEILQIFDMQN